MSTEPTAYDKKQDERIEELKKRLDDIDEGNGGSGQLGHNPVRDGDIEIKYKTIGDGVEYEFSSSTEDRYQLKAKLNKCYVNLAQIGYFKIARVNNNDEEISGKNRGGRHSDSAPDEGSCYIQGIGYDSSANCQYEQPHPDNHPLDHTVDREKPYGNSIIGKWVGIQNIIYFKDGKDHLETWVDLKADEIDTKGKPGNEWVKFWHTETRKFAGQCNAPDNDVLSFWRLDDIPDGDEERNCERKYCKIYEIEPPT